MTNSYHPVDGLAPTGLAVLRTLMSTAAEGIIVEDLENRIVALNSAILRIFNFDDAYPTAFLGKSRENFEKSAVRTIVSLEQIPVTVGGQKVAEISTSLIKFDDGAEYERHYYPIFEGSDITGHVWMYLQAGIEIGQRFEQAQAAMELNMVSADDKTSVKIWTRNKLIQGLSSLVNKDAHFMVLIRIKHVTDLIEAIGSIKVGRFINILNAALSKAFVSPSVYRVNHDEILFLSEDGDSIKLIRKLEEIRKQICQSDEIYFEIQLAVGISRCRKNNDPVSIETTLDECRVALNASRHLGHEVIFSPQILQSEARRDEVIFALPRAIRDHKLVLHFQPIVELTSGKIIGYEGLSRWIHTVLGEVTAQEFIDVASELNYLTELDRHNFHTLVREASKLKVNDLVGVGLNISSSFLDPRMGLLDTLEEFLSQFPATPGQMVIELTESELVTDYARIHSTLERVRDLGVKIAIDDFGVGNSSLALLQNIPFDYLKLDKSFAVGIGKPRTRALVGAIAGIADSFDAKTIAEGIETKEQSEVMQELGIYAGQGFFFGKPAPAPTN